MPGTIELANEPKGVNPGHWLHLQTVAQERVGKAGQQTVNERVDDFRFVSLIDHQVFKSD
jgi:hypothetical protein